MAKTFRQRSAPIAITLRTVGKLSRPCLAAYALAKAKNITWPLPADMDEQKLEALIYPAKPRSGEFQLPDFQKMHLELRSKGVTLQLLWSEYAAAHEQRAYRYSQFCEHYRRWVRIPVKVISQTNKDRHCKREPDS